MIRFTPNLSEQDRRRISAALLERRPRQVYDLAERPSLFGDATPWQRQGERIPMTPVDAGEEAA